MAQSDIFTATVDHIAAGGAGCFKLDGKTIFMDRTAPGDRVAGRISLEKPSWAQAELVELVTPGPERVEPFCPYYGSCGGCTLQHLSYEAQLSQKKRILSEAFLRIAGYDELPDITIIPSQPSEYRNRMQFHRVKHPKHGTSRVGLIARESTEVLPISDCPIAVEGIRRALTQGILQPSPEKDRFTVFSQGETLLEEGKHSRGYIHILNKTLAMDPGLFFQGNLKALEKLIPDLLKLALEVDRTERAADLYCGVGTFSVFLKDHFMHLDLLEREGKALSLAKENLRGVDVRYFAQKDETWARLEELKGTTFAVVDPPRLGLSPGLRQGLATMGPPLVAYVSCDSATMARDAGELRKAGYVMESLTIYDFYPQTAHIESLGVFRRIP